MDDLKTLIREVPDFPKPGILFYDITTLLKDKAGFASLIDQLAEHYLSQDVDLVLKIKRLLYDEGFTIAGARRHLRDQAVEPNGTKGETTASGASSNWTPPEKGRAERPSLALNRKTLLDLRDSLRSFLTLLEHE